MEENRGRRLFAVVAVAGALVAAPAGVALAGGSGGADQGSAGSGSQSIQSTAPDRQDRDRGGGDCPEKRGSGGGQSSIEL